ncbi:MAG: hypothetical protein RIC35_14350 [Marinoscillum sp.]
MKSLFVFTKSIIRNLFYRGILPVLLAGVLMVSQASTIKAQHQLPSNIHVENITSQKVINAFVKVVNRYETLKKYKITLVQSKINSSTMQAQPVYNWNSFFRGVKSYQVKVGKYVRDSDHIKVEDLDEDVLTGWFAHELGHIVDYEPYSNIEMLKYGLKYMFSDEFKKKVEYAADYIAITYDFKKEILASKRYILENDLLDNAYKDKIKKYYLSIEDVELCTKDEIVMKPVSGI